VVVQIANERLYPRWKNWSGFAHAPVRLHPMPSSGSAVTMPAMLVVREFEKLPLEGRTASGLDVPLRILAETLADEVVTTQANLWPEAAPRPKAIRPVNQRALALLDQWMSEPDELGSAWWEAFEAELKQNRLAFREA